MCINSHNFLRPIASVAFNERADELAVAAGHKVHCVNSQMPALRAVQPGVAHVTTSMRRACAGLTL